MVTGASRRVGSAIALELAAHGFDVCVHVRGDVDGGEATAAAVRAHGGEAWVVSSDLATAQGCELLADAVRARWSSLDVLVHNASGFSPDPFESTSLDALDAMWAIHGRAPFLLTQALLPLLRAGRGADGARSGEAGLVVGIVDIGAVRPVTGYAAYSMSKAALGMFVKALAVELAPTVRAVAVSPGQVAWPPDYDEALRGRITARIPMRRVGEPSDIAKLVRFVALEAPYLNGVTIDVDGGLAVRYG